MSILLGPKRDPFGVLKDTTVSRVNFADASLNVTDIVEADFPDPRDELADKYLSEDARTLLEERLSYLQTHADKKTEYGFLNILNDKDQLERVRRKDGTLTDGFLQSFVSSWESHRDYEEKKKNQKWWKKPWHEKIGLTEPRFPS